MICCNTCGMKIPGKDSCDFATIKKMVEGKEYVFCCPHCAEDIEEK